MKKINKSSLLIVSIILLIVIGIIVLISTNSTRKALNKKEELESLLTTMTSEYYEKFYYVQIGNTLEERELFLKRYKSTGLQISLDSLSRYNSEVNKKRIEKFVNPETNKKCDIKNTMSILYPEEPYEKKSYKIKVKLDCGFKEDK